MSGYGYLHSIHDSKPYWRVSWYWKSTGQYNASYAVDKAQSKDFKSESGALDFASRKRFAQTQSWKPTPITKVYVSKVEPVMRWELDESITVLETDKYGVQTCRRKGDVETFKRCIINGSEIRFISTEDVAVAKALSHD